MSIWAEHDLTAKIFDVLAHLQGERTHHFGRPYVTAYQLAIELQHRHPDTVAAIG